MVVVLQFQWDNNQSSFKYKRNPIEDQFAAGCVD